jgi:hypothetical protein
MSDDEDEDNPTMSDDEDEDEDAPVFQVGDRVQLLPRFHGGRDNPRQGWSHRLPWMAIGIVDSGMFAIVDLFFN